MIDFRQFILLAIAVFVPLTLILTRRDRLLLLWICVTVAINIFDTNIFVNLPAARIAGLMLIPIVIRMVPGVIRTQAGLTLFFIFFYLIYLGFLFGFLMPWSGGDFDRAFNQTAQGRSLIYLIRTTADMSLILFIAKQILRWDRPEVVIKYMLVGTTIAASAGIFEWMFQFDLYSFITGLRPLSLDYRARGFNYEPRGLGLITAHGFLICMLLLSRVHSIKWLLLFGLHIIALLLTGSTSAIIIVVAGFGVLFLFSPRIRPMVMVSVTFGTFLFFILLNNGEPWLQAYIDNIRLRVVTGAIGVVSTGVLDAIAYRIGVFDGSALLFLSSNPLYGVIGTGPGLVSLPATFYMPESVSYDWLVQIGAGINTPPSFGFFLELSNTGLIGGALWIFFLLASYKAFRYLTVYNRQQEHWAINAIVFFIAAALYCLQASPLSAIWPVFLGTAVAAACKARIHRLEMMRSINVETNL
jgi:ABC-type multidrug transport system fused ATPase/permease subunit